MLTSEMVADVRAHGFDDTSEAVILSLLNDAYFDVCSREPWPFLEATATVTVDSEGKITAPDNVQSILALVNTESGITLYPARLDELTGRYAADLDQVGTSKWYYNIANDFYLYPIPSGGTFTVRYTRNPVALTASPDSTPILPIMHHRVIVMGALAKAAVMEDDPDLAAVFTNMFETRISQMRSHLWQKQFDEPDTIKVVDWEDYADELWTW